MSDFKDRENTFSAISVKKIVASRFREFSKGVSSSHTETLTTMMNFFEYNNLSPGQPLEFTIGKLEGNIKKRINALIAIIKDIEKHQTQPTTAMLQLLFEQTETKPKQPRLVEVKQSQKRFEQDSFATSLEAIELRKEKNIYKQRFEDARDELEVVLAKINIVKSTFGSPKIKLDISIEELEMLKLKNRITN